MIKRTLAGAALAVLALFATAACSDGPSRPCLSGHDETVIIPMYCGKGCFMMLPSTSFHCDKYGPMPSKSP